MSLWYFQSHALFVGVVNNALAMFSWVSGISSGIGLTGGRPRRFFDFRIGLHL